jgi:hypothetical protein
MIATVVPSLLHIQETIRTLRYASRAKRITLRPQQNVSDPKEQVTMFRQPLDGSMTHGVYAETKHAAKATQGSAG